MEEMRKRIGLQISTIDNGLSTDILNAVEERCAERNMDLIVFPGGGEINESATNEQASIYTHITPKNLDGLIITSDFFDKERNRYLRAQEKKYGAVPKISLQGINNEDDEYLSNFQDVYGQLIGHMITEHHCRIFNIIAGSKGHQINMMRLKICLQVLSENGIRIEEERIFYGTLGEHSGYGAMIYFYQKQLMPADCIIALNDDMAIGVTNFVTSHNLSIPRDFRLIGCDNILRARFNRIPLSTVDVQSARICRSTVDYLENYSEETSANFMIASHCTLNLRHSCGCIPAEDKTTDYIDDEGNTVNYGENDLKTLSSDYFTLEHEVLLMREFFNSANETTSIRSALSNLQHAFPSLHIRSCAVILFERQINTQENTEFELPARAQIMMCYDELTFKGGSDQNESSNKLINFNPQEELLPKGIFSNRRRVLFVKALAYGNSVFGYVIYEPGDLHRALYDTAFSMVSSTLSSAILFTQKTATEQHQRVMLKQLEHSNNELTHTSLSDELTGLYNRRGVVSFGQQTIDLAVEMEQTGLVFYADMDGLKGINDTYGHECGDIAIKTMSSILRQTFRNQDVLGRMGGDEFVIVAVGITEQFLPRIRERIKNAEAKWYAEEKPPFHIGISFGAVPFDDKKFDLEQLMEDADKLLYEEKVKKHSRSSIKEAAINYENE